ncbi:histidine permease [Elasticomyces elasticus]|nr:histidine permease [Elasticomyces elasticus]
MNRVMEDTVGAGEKDVERGAKVSHYASNSPSESSKKEAGYIDIPEADTRWGRFVDSFKRNPNAKVSPQAEDAEGRPIEDGPSAEPALAMKLNNRHLQMIAIGGSIGTGLFVRSGAALSTGGPASLILAYGLIGVMLFCTVQALGELAVAFPVAGSFAVYGSRFLDPAWGFAMGWNLDHSAVLGDAKNTKPAAFVTIFLVVIIINFFGVKGYGEAEFVFSIIRSWQWLASFCLALSSTAEALRTMCITACTSGAFNNGFKGLCSVFTTAAFAFAGTELVGLAAAESANPRVTLPKAVKQVFWRICLFYMVSLTIVGSLVPYNDPELLGASSTDANASPFVIAVKNAGITAVPSIMNAVILIAVLSVGNSSIYGSSRTLAALADRGQAPKILGYIDRSGCPLMAIILSSMFCFLCYIVAAGANAETTALSWMLALSGLSSIFTWGSICLCHIHFRQAWKAAGHTLDELAFKSQATVYGSWIGFIFNCLVVVVSFWTGFAPIGYASNTASQNLVSWFEANLSLPIVMAFYFIYKFVKKTKIKTIDRIDITSGMRDMNLKEILAEERAIHAKWPMWNKVYRTVC